MESQGHDEWGIYEMSLITTFIGAIVGLLGLALLPLSVLVAILVAVNVRGIRDRLYQRVARFPGFRSKTSWKATIASFGYLFLAGLLMFSAGATLVPPVEDGEENSTTQSTETIGTTATSTHTTSLTQTVTTTPTPTPTTTTTTTTPTTTTTCEPQTPPPSEVPEYTLVTVEDVSYRGVIRSASHVETERPVSNLSEEELRLIAQDISAKAITEVDLNANSVFFWEEDDVIGGEVAYARVDWAPYGDWSRAGEVETGEYCKHEFTVEILSSTEE